MAKNRKNTSAAIRFGPAIKAFLLCSLFVAAGVGYVWQKGLIEELRSQAKKSEQALAEYRDKNRKLSEHLAGLRSPLQLKARLRESDLGLELPLPKQVWWLSEPVEPPPPRPSTAGPQYAARP